MSDKKWEPSELFREYTENEVHSCCSCCDGFCPRWDGGDDWAVGDPLLIVNDAYVSDRYVAIDRSRIALDNLDEKYIKDGPTGVKWLTAPKSLSEKESTRSFTPSLAGPLLAAGIEIRHADVGVGDRHPQHLVYGGEHIGFIMPVKDDDDEPLPTIPQLRRLIESAPPLVRGITDLLGGYPLDNLWALVLASDELHPISRDVRAA